MLVGKPVAGSDGKSSRQRVAEAHVHAALDLALAQHRVDRLADVVDRDDLLDSCRSRDRSRRVASRSRTRSGSSDSDGRDHRGAASSRRGARPRSRRRAGIPRPSAATHALRTEPAAISVPREPVVCPKPSSRVVSTITSMRLGSMPKLLRRHLQRDGVHTLAHLGPAVANLDRRRRCGIELHDRRHSSRKPLPSPEFFSPRPSPTALPAATGRVVVRLDRVEADLGAAAAVVHDLAGAPHVAGVDHVALADLPTVDADQLGEPIEHALHRELRLVGAEATERAADRVVGAHGDRSNVDRRHVVRRRWRDRRRARAPSSRRWRRRRCRRCRARAAR